MATTSVSQYIATLRRAPERLAAGNKSAVMRCAAAAKPIMERAPGAASTVAGKPIRVTVVAVGAETAMVKWGPAGLVRILNDPTKAHDIFPRKFLGTRGTGKRAQKGAALMASLGLNARSGQGGVKLRDGSIRHSVHHPGTKGKHFVETGKAEAVPVVKDMYGRLALTEPLRSVFRG